MLRVPLEELVLQIHLLRLGRAGAFLAAVLEPPPERSVAAAVKQLQAIGALTPAEKLTPLGARLDRARCLHSLHVILGSSSAVACAGAPERRSFIVKRSSRKVHV